MLITHRGSWEIKEILPLRRQQCQHANRRYRETDQKRIIGGEDSVDLKVFLPKAKVNFWCWSCYASLSNASCRSAGSAEVYTNVCPQCPFQSSDVWLIHDPVPHCREELGEIRATVLCSGPELRQGINLHSDAVEYNVLSRIYIESLGEIRVDPQELLILSAALPF